MENISKWAVLICAACSICILTEFLIPPGKIEKTMRRVLGAFMICAFIIPLSPNGAFKQFDFKNVCSEKTSKQNKEILEKINLQAESIAKENLIGVISGVLKDIGIKSKKIEIFMDKNADNCIVVIRCKIYLKPGDNHLKEKIKSEVENKLKIKTDVVCDV